MVKLVNHDVIEMLFCETLQVSRAAERLNGSAQNIDLTVPGLPHVETDTGARSNAQESLCRLFKNFFSVRDKQHAPRTLLLRIESGEPCFA